MKNYNQLRFTTLIILFLLISLGIQSKDEWNPIADESAVVVSGKARFTILTPQLIRIQYSSTSKFEDRATFAVVNRKLEVPEFTVNESDGYLTIQTAYLTLKYKVGSAITNTQKNSNILGISFTLNGTRKLWYPGKDDALNLLGTSRTLDGDIGDTHRVSLEKGLLSRDGWAVLDESPKTKRGDGSQSFAFDTPVDGIPWVAKPVDATALDLYFFGYGHEYKKALGDYVRIAGRQPLPPYYMFGYWYSKYQAYTSSQFQQLVTDMEKKDVPHDVMMFDCDWHQNSWTGWTWNKSLISSPTTLLNWMHTHNMRVALNLHPADGIGSSDDNFSKMRNEMGLGSDVTTIPWQLEDSTFYRSFFKNIMRVREKEGVDFWWIDWQQDKTSSYISGLGQTFWLNHVFYNDMKLNRPNRRPVIFHRWGGMGSHRYPLGFSGDTFATFGTLQFESYFTATAANVCFGYWGHDGGGYLQPNNISTDPELVLRWMQFCVFQPIFRTHGSSQSGCERRIWKFSNFDLQNEAFKLRYRLVPYIYSMARKAYDTGVSICRPLYYEWPEENKAYSIEDEYLFGDDILVSPISTATCADGTSVRKTWLPQGGWYDVMRNKLIEGETEITDDYALNEIPYFIRQGAIITCNPDMKNLKTTSNQLILWVIPGGDGATTLYEDQGDNDGYENGEYCTTTITQQTTDGTTTLTIAPRQGSYSGMITARSYETVFFCTERPQHVLIDNCETTDWTYDEVLKRLTVTTPSKACESATTIQFVTNETGINTIEADNISMQYSAMNNEITISTSAESHISIHITDLQGRSWMEQDFASCRNAKVDISVLPTGQYACNANIGGKTITRKIIKL